jgi:hypothetical protein
VSGATQDLRARAQRHAPTGVRPTHHDELQDVVATRGRAGGPSVEVDDVAFGQHARPRLTSRKLSAGAIERRDDRLAPTEVAGHLVDHVTGGARCGTRHGEVPSVAASDDREGDLR